MPRALTGAQMIQVSGRGRLPRDEADRRVENFLDLALAEFTKKGFFNTSMNGLVEKSGVSKTTIFRRFGNKEGLFLALADRSLTRLHADLASLPIELADPRRTLIGFARAFDGSMHQEAGVAFLRLAISERLNSPQLAKMVLDNMLRTLQPLADYLGALARQGVLRETDTVEAAFDFVALINQGVRFLIDDMPPVGNNRREELIVERFLAGWGPHTA